MKANVFFVCSGIASHKHWSHFLTNSYEIWYRTKDVLTLCVFYCFRSTCHNKCIRSIKILWEIFNKAIFILKPKPNSEFISMFCLNFAVSGFFQEYTLKGREHPIKNGLQCIKTNSNGIKCITRLICRMNRLALLSPAKYQKENPVHFHTF